MGLPTTTNTDAPVSTGYAFRLGSTFLRPGPGSDGGMLDVDTADLKQTPDTSSKPEDRGADSKSLMFSQVDFSGGAGQDYAHREGSEPDRFWKSEGVEYVRDKGVLPHVKLARDHDLVHDATVDPTQPYAPQTVVDSNNVAYLADGDSVDVIDKVTEATPTITSEVVSAGATVNCLAQNHDDIFAATTAGVFKRAAASWSQVTTGVYDRIFGLKGRLIATSGNELYEVSLDGTARLIATVGSSFAFTCACDAGAAVLAGATDGYVYAFATVEGNLLLRQQTYFPDEEITGLGESNGLVLVGTREAPNVGRWTVGRLGGDYVVKSRQVLWEWELSLSDFAAPAHIVTTRDYAYIGLRSDGGALELWKYDLETGAVLRTSFRSTATLGFAGLALAGDRLVYVNEGGALYVESTRYESFGYLISSLADNFDPDEKVWAAYRLLLHQTTPLTSARLYATTDPEALSDPLHPSWTFIASRATRDDDEVAGGGLTGRWLGIKLELYSDDGTASPEVRGFTARGYPHPGDSLVRFSVNLSDMFSRPGRKPTRIPGLGKEIYDFLLAQEGQALELELLRTGEVYRGTVNRVRARSPQQTSRGSQMLTGMVEFTGRRV